MVGAQIPDRFRIVRELGVGGMGVVYEAEDRERGERVALKTVDRPTPEMVYRLKREFRILAGIRHPNLVTLHELIASDRGCIYTMELVDGVPLRDYVVGPGGVDEARLRACLGQLATGLAALHLLGKVHRDIKPANILVTPERRVVLVDFGLAVSTELGDDSASGPLLGTTSYVAPEQATGAEPSPAADWYSVGVMLYEILAGRLPFRGAPLTVLAAKQKKAPPPPSAVAGPMPPDLDQLCLDLLAPRPADRPTDAEILRRLGLDPNDERLEADTTDYALAPSVPLTGRDADVDQIAAALGAGGPRAVLLRGPSGIGKTALARAALDRLASSSGQTLVVSGRCYERETVPYKALDGVIDELSRFWRELPPDGAARLVPDNAGALRRIFPVLGRVPALLRSAVGESPADPRTLRGRGLAGLRELLANIARERRVVLYLDDMQWVDGDTAMLLADLMRPPQQPPVALLMTARVGAPLLDELVERLAEHGLTVDQVDVPPLTRDAAALLARSHLGDDETELADWIAAESEGNPFFIGELARHARTRGRAGGAPTLAEALGDRIAGLDGAAREVLELLAVAVEPVSNRVVRSATGISAAALASTVRELAGQRLVRGAGARSTDRIETYHDRVREVVAAAMSADDRARHHRELAVGLEAWAEGGPERLMRHWQGAGDTYRAADQARLAADRAMATLDVDRAAGLYRIALDAGRSTAATLELSVALAEALSAAGRPREACEVFLSAVEVAPAERHGELRRRAAEELMRGGYLHEGLEVIGPLMAERGIRLPTGEGAALVSVIARRTLARIRGFRWRRGESSPAELERVDILRAVATGLNLSDYIRGADAQVRHMLAALRCGDPARIAHALAHESGHLAGQGSQRARKAAAAARRLADEEGDHLAQSFADFADGVVSYYLDNAWQRSLASLNAAERGFLAHVTAGFELDMIHLFICFNLLYAGELPELAERVPELIAHAERRGDRYDAINMRTRMNLVWLVDGRPDYARAQVRLAIDKEIPTSARYLAQHFFAMFARSEIALYQGAPQEAARLIEADLAALQSSLLLRIKMVKVELAQLRARVGLALARRAESAAERQALIDEARGHAAWLSKQREPVAGQQALLVEAGAAALTGGPEAAEEALGAAIEAFEAGGTHLYAAAARMRSGDPEVAERGERWMSERGVADPEALADVLAPGW